MALTSLSIITHRRIFTVCVCVCVTGAVVQLHCNHDNAKLICRCWMSESGWVAALCLHYGFVKTSHGPKNESNAWIKHLFHKPLY